MVALNAAMYTNSAAQTFAVDRISFTSQNSITTNKWLTDWNTDFGSDSGNLYFPNGFYAGTTPKASPVAIFGGAKVRINVGLYLDRWVDYTFDARGFVGNNQVTILGCDTATVFQDWPAYTDAIVPAKVDVINDWMSNWTANGDFGNPAYIWTATAHNKMYVTWAKPIASLYTPTANTSTLKRMEYVCNAAKGSTSLLTASDKVWDIVAAQAVNTNYLTLTTKPIVPAGQNDLKILDGTYSGECDEQARLMHRALGVLGISSEVKLMRASTNLADVFNVETRDVFDPVLGRTRPAYLMMDFNTSGANHAWNSFEACCAVSGRHYAVWPKFKADSAAALFTTIPFRQFWVFTTEDKAPGSLLSDGVHYAFFDKLADSSEVPKPTS